MIDEIFSWILIFTPIAIFLILLMIRFVKTKFIKQNLIEEKIAEKEKRRETQSEGGMIIVHDVRLRNSF